MNETWSAAREREEKRAVEVVMRAGGRAALMCVRPPAHKPTIIVNEL